MADVAAIRLHTLILAAKMQEVFVRLCVSGCYMDVREDEKECKGGFLSLASSAATHLSEDEQNTHTAGTAGVGGHRKSS